VGAGDGERTGRGGSDSEGGWSRVQGEHWIYALLVLVTFLPMVPNSALVAGAGALAATGTLSLPLLLTILLVSAVLGDLGVFWSARRSRPRALRCLHRTTGRRAVLETVSGRFLRYGVPAVIAVRFVPGGRGLGGLTAGIIGFPFRRFLLGAALAEAVFVLSTVGLGYVGGRVTAHPLAPLLIGPGVSLLVAGVAMLAQRADRGPDGPFDVIPRIGATSRPNGGSSRDGRS
jgi:membrane protein DedA with SNARE-associated domain